MSCRTEHGGHSSCVNLTSDRRKRPLESWEFPLTRLRLDCFMGEGNCARDCSALSNHLGLPVARDISRKITPPAIRVVKPGAKGGPLGDVSICRRIGDFGVC